MACLIIARYLFSFLLDPPIAAKPPNRQTAKLPNRQTAKPPITSSYKLITLPESRRAARLDFQPINCLHRRRQVSCEQGVNWLGLVLRGSPEFSSVAPWWLLMASRADPGSFLAPLPAHSVRPLALDILEKHVKTSKWQKGALCDFCTAAGRRRWSSLGKRAGLLWTYLAARYRRRKVRLRQERETDITAMLDSKNMQYQLTCRPPTFNQSTWCIPAIYDTYAKEDKRRVELFGSCRDQESGDSTRNYGV